MTEIGRYSRHHDVRSLLPFGIFLLLMVGAALPACSLRMHLFTVLSGTVPLLFMRRRWGLVTLLLLSVPVSLLMWSGITLVLGTISIRYYALSPWIVALLSGLVIYRQQVAKHCPPAQIRVKPNPGEWCAIGFAILGLFFMGVMWLQNGLWPAPNGNMNWIYCQVWSGMDCLYLCALAEQVLMRGGWPVENPFMAGVGNYYPSLCHCGLAGLTYLRGNCVYVGAMSWMVTHGACSAGLLGLVCCRFAGSMRKWHGVFFGAIAALFFVIQRGDLLFFPQTSFLVTPVLLLLAWLLFDLKGHQKAMRATAIAIVIAYLLIISHTVSSVVAGVLLTVVMLSMLARPSTRRAGFAVMIALVGIGILFLAMNHFPYAGVPGYYEREWLSWQQNFRVLTLPVLIVLSIGIVGVCFLRGSGLFRGGIILFALATAGLLYQLQGVFAPDGWNRWFRMFNSVRFWQLGLLFTIPFFAHIKSRIVALAVPSLLILATFIFPNSTMSLSLAPFSQPSFKFVNAKSEGILKYLREKTEPTDVISSNYPHFFSAFTGRCELMADEENCWGMDTLPPEKFWSMREEYLRLWTSDSWTTVTPSMRAEIAQTARVRWLVYVTTPDDNEGTVALSKMLGRYPKDFVTPFLFSHPLALFRANWGMTETTTTTTATTEAKDENIAN